MAGNDSFISNYEHLHTLPRADSALLMLRKIASLVKPLMRKRGWHVGTLVEMSPERRELLGMNENAGARILLRLRYPNDHTLFMPLEEVTDTMLHELSHNVHGPHDKPFHDLWNKLRDEYDELKRKGYSGEGFLGNGNMLGGRRIPMHEMRRQARVQAEERKKRQALTAGSGQKLGGRPVLRGVDMRAVIANAVEKRSRITSGCGSGTKAGAEAAKGTQGFKTHNGFKTKKEEDEANERAIADALWELIQNEEDKKAGLEPEVWIAHGPATSHSKQPISPEVHTSSKPRPTGTKSTKSSNSAPPAPAAVGNKISPPNNYADRDYNVLRPRHTSRLVAEDEQRRRISGLVDLTSSEDGEDSPRTPSSWTSSSPRHEGQVNREIQPRRRPQYQQSPGTWACGVCTLVNPVTYLACDACGVERPSVVSEELFAAPQPEVQTRPPSQASGWNCSRCGNFMERQWWTCSACGTMKETS